MCCWESCMPEGCAPLHKTGVGQYLLWFSLAGTFLAAFLPVVTSLFGAWSGSDDNSHGFLVIPIALYIVRRKRESIIVEESACSWPGLVVAALSLAVYLFAQAGEIITLASLTLISFLGGSVIFLFGYRVFRVLLFPLFLLLFMIPVPAQILATLTIPLQMLVTKAAVTLSTLAGIPLYREGNVILHAQGTFEVVQACSGLRSITALLMLGAVFGYFTLGSNFLRTLLFVSAVPIAVLVNILRVFSMVAALHFLGSDLTHGAPHTVLGIVVFGIAVGFFLLVQKGLARCGC